MLQLTIREALECEDEETGEHYIYLYKEDATVFYVGRSIHPFERLRQHIGQAPRSPFPDAIGSLILNNRPVSLS